MNRYHKYIFVFFVFNAFKGYSQYTIENFEKYTIRHGLASNHITSLIQDSFGYVWIGTLNGLQKFDGLEFENVKMPIHSHAANNIYQLNKLWGNEIGVCTSEGAFIYSMANGSIKPLKFETEEEFKYWAYAIKGIGKDIKGNYGVSSGTGFYVFGPDGTLRKRYEPYSKDVIGTQWLRFGRNVHTMSDGKMIQENMDGMAVYDFDGDTIIVNKSTYGCLSNKENINNIRYGFLHDTLMYSFPSTSKLVIQNMKTCQTFEWNSVNKDVQYFAWFSTMQVINDSTIVINGRHGLYTLKPNYQNFTFYLNTTPIMEGFQFLQCLKTKEGKLVLGTKDGLYFEKSKKHIVPIVQLPAVSNLDVSISHILPEGENLYVSTNNKGIYIIDTHSKAIKKHMDFSQMGKGYNEISFVYPYTNDSLWISTASGILWFHPKSHRYAKLEFEGCESCLQNIDVNDIFRDSKGEYWFGSNASNYVGHVVNHKMEVLKQDKNNPLLKVTAIIYISEDTQNNMWFTSDAIVRWNRQTQKVDSLIQRVKGQNSFLRGYKLYFDVDGNKWFVIFGEGIIIETKSGERIKLFDDLLIPKSNSKYCGMFNNHLVYVNIRNQIVVINMANRLYRAYSEFDGLEESAITSKFSYDKASNSILFGVKNNIYALSFDFPSSEHNHSIIVEKVVSSTMEPISFPSGPIVLEAKHRSFGLDFGIINFTDPQNVQYSYRLIPSVDTAWIDLNLPHIYFNELAAGRYQLELKAVSRNNFWKPVTKIIDIIILPPFYYTWWFLSLMVILFGLGVLLIVKNRYKKLNELAQLDRSVAEYEMKALHAQMNPHFVFNCLNSIKEMIISKENDNASRYLTKFSTMMRATIDHSKKNWSSVYENMEYIETYLEMESLRFENFRYTVSMDEAIESREMLMAPMLLQPIVENAIWHGLMKNTGDKVLYVHIAKDNDYIVCTIDDNGIGYNTAIKQTNIYNGIGLSNIRSRIEIINQKFSLDYSITIFDKSEIGQYGTKTVVRFLPKYLFEE